MPGLPLDDPRWRELETDGLPIPAILAALGSLRATGDLAAFDPTAGTLHQGSVYGAAFAVLPHVVDVAARTGAHAPETWIALGTLVSAWRIRPCPVPDFLRAEHEAALAHAEPMAARALLAVDLPPCDAAYLALAALALGGHPAGRWLWAVPEEPTHALALFATTVCPSCDAETEWIALRDGIAALHALDRPPTTPDPRQPPVALRTFPLRDPWTRAASGDERDGLHLAAALLASRGHVERAHALARLAGEVRCPECDATAAFVAAVP